ncbi:unnamed protein product, partial [Vitis vinifera]
MGCGFKMEVSPNPNPSADSEPLAVPPLDPDFFSDNSNDAALHETFMSDLGLDGVDFDFTFDDLYFPSESEDFLADFPLPEEGSGGHDSADRSFDVSGDRNSDVSSIELGCCDQKLSPPVASQSSSDQNLDVNSPLLDSGNSDHSSWVPSSPNLADNSWGVVDQKVKLEDSGKNSVPKRKKEQDDSTTESRSSKFRRSSICSETANASNDEEEKKKARLMRNRESAQLSRQRKKHYVEELEEKIRSMHSTIQDLTGKISIIMAENANLRQQFGGGGMCPPPHAGMYPHPSMAPMAYPWVPCAPYVVKPQGSQVPLVPIPRLKPQAPVSAPKVKKTENKKNETKSKKVVSVSLLGMLSFMFLMGCLVPFVNIKYGGIKETVPGRSDYISNRFSDMHRRRILTVKDDLNGSNYGMGVGFDDRIHRGSKPLPGSDGYAHSRNASEPLVASLYVPRNDKLVKIDGNLIIHSVLASEKAMASHAALAKKSPKPSVSLANDVRETGLAIAGNLATAFPVSEPTSTDGKLQQWFREGLAGPMLSSGMCTEVFQFDVSPAPGAIVPVSSVANISAENQQNATHLNKGRNRRILHGLPIPLAGSTHNITEEGMGRNSQKDNFQGSNKNVSSMVVSVLFDPREAGDSDGDGMMGPKSLSRIFVVVLLDSVKYVTYSCGLPLKASAPHLVTK